MMDEQPIAKVVDVRECDGGIEFTARPLDGRMAALVAADAAPTADEAQAEMNLLASELARMLDGGLTMYEMIDMDIFDMHAEGGSVEHQLAEMESVARYLARKFDSVLVHLDRDGCVACNAAFHARFIANEGTANDPEAKT